MVSAVTPSSRCVNSTLLAFHKNNRPGSTGTPFTPTVSVLWRPTVTPSPLMAFPPTGSSPSPRRVKWDPTSLASTSLSRRLITQSLAARRAPRPKNLTTPTTTLPAVRSPQPSPETVVPRLGMCGISSCIRSSSGQRISSSPLKRMKSPRSCMTVIPCCESQRSRLT